MIIIKDENNIITTYDPVGIDIKPEQYLTYDEVIDKVIDELSTADLDIIHNMKYDNLITLHSGLGMWIRNTFGLWHEENKLTNSGLFDDEKHPDNLSFDMIKKLWNILQTNGVPDKKIQSKPLDI